MIISYSIISKAGPGRSGALEGPLIEWMCVGVSKSMQPNSGSSEFLFGYVADVPPALLALSAPLLSMVALWFWGRDEIGRAHV